MNVMPLLLYLGFWVKFITDFVRCCMQAAGREVPAAETQVWARVEGKQASVDGQGRADVAAVTGWSTIRHTAPISQPLSNWQTRFRSSVTRTVQFS